MTTNDYFREQGQRLAAHMAEEAEHLFTQWATWDEHGTAEALKELSTVAATFGGAFHKLAGDALEMAERLEPTPVGFSEFTQERARLWLVKREEFAAEVAAGEHDYSELEA